MNPSAIRTDRAPLPTGPFSQAVCSGGLIFVSGQDGRVPGASVIASDTLEVQVRQALSNLAAILEAAGSSMDLVVKATCYLTDISGFRAFNQIYLEFFPNCLPARSTVEVSRLVPGALFEIDAIAVAGAGRVDNLG